MHHKINSEVQKQNSLWLIWKLSLLTLLSLILLVACDTPTANGNGSNNGVGNGNSGNCNGVNNCNTSPPSNPTPTGGSSNPPTSTPTPTETSCPAPASASSSTGNVDAMVTGKGCPAEVYSVTWVFGFVSGNGLGMTSSSFMSYGSGQSLGYISQLGIAPTAPYSGTPRNAWLSQLGSGYAIVISDTAAQPTADQLGHAALFGGFVNWEGGTYLSQNFELVSTTPQPGGAQGYQFNLVIKP